MAGSYASLTCPPTENTSRMLPVELSSYPLILDTIQLNADSEEDKASFWKETR